MATTSQYGNFRHGAVLVGGGNAILGIGVNNEKYCSVGAKHRHPNKGVSTYHAEISCILGIERKAIRGSTIYVARASKASGEDRMSKPCPMCHAVLASQGVRKVFYTVDKDNVGFYRIY
jgi:tRNA(Arg) A34 adenosine deaminase TadA